MNWHPRLSYFIVSDGYMATVLRVLDQPSPALLLKTLLQDATKDLQKASENVEKSQVMNQSRPLTELQIFMHTHYKAYNKMSSDLFLLD